MQKLALQGCKYTTFHLPAGALGHSTAQQKYAVMLSWSVHTLGQCRTEGLAGTSLR